MSEYNFHDPVIMGKAMKLICKSKAMYYIDCEGMIRIHYNKKWITYSAAEKIYPKEFTIT